MSRHASVHLKESERIIATIRRFGLTYMRWWIALFLLFTAPFFFLFWLFSHGWWGQTILYLLLATGLFLLVRLLFLWRTNVLLVTSHRLIDIHRPGFFDTTVSEVPYDQIEDVAGTIRGFWGTVFRYGTIVVQTGGGRVEIHVERVRQPLLIQQQINEMRDRYLTKHVHNFSGDVTNLILDKLYELERDDLLRVKTALERRIEKLSPSGR